MCACWVACATRPQRSRWANPGAAPERSVARPLSGAGRPQRRRRAGAIERGRTALQAGVRAPRRAPARAAAGRRDVSRLGWRMDRPGARRFGLLRQGHSPARAETRACGVPFMSGPALGAGRAGGDALASSGCAASQGGARLRRGLEGAGARQDGDPGFGWVRRLRAPSILQRVLSGFGGRRASAASDFAAAVSVNIHRILGEIRSCGRPGDLAAACPSLQHASADGAASGRRRL